MDDLPSLKVHDRLTTSTSNPSLFQDRNTQFEERFMSQKDSPQRTTRRFATLEEENDHFCQEIQEFNKEMREFFDRQDVERAIKTRSCNLLIEGNKNKKKNRKMPKKMECGPVVDDDTTELLKRFITGDMYGLHMRLVIQKVLYETDMNTTQNRLSMPIKQLETHPDEFLTVDEKRIIDESKEGMEVRVVGPMLQMYERPLWLKMWHLQHSDNYVLKKNWNNFVADNKVLKKGTVIQVWSFRKDRRLCFAIVPVETQCGMMT